MNKNNLKINTLSTMSVVKQSIITAVCIALCVVLPMAFHSIPQAGMIYCPMHIPVLICGIICVPQYAIICGIAGALLSSVLTGMPPAATLPSMLWLKHFGNRAYMLNDDKPAIRLIDGKVYACGTPWSGKYDYSTPQVVELAGICFLQRSENNWIKKAETSKAVFNIFSQTVRKLDAVNMEKLFDVLEQIFSKIPIYDLGCNISDEAVLTSYNAMKPKDCR